MRRWRVISAALTVIAIIVLLVKLGKFITNEEARAFLWWNLWF